MKMYCFAKNYMFKKTSELYEFLQKNQFVCAIIASLFIISILTLMWGGEEINFDICNQLLFINRIDIYM